MNDFVISRTQFHGKFYVHRHCGSCRATTATVRCVAPRLRADGWAGWLRRRSACATVGGCLSSLLCRLVAGRVLLRRLPQSPVAHTPLWPGFRWRFESAAKALPGVADFFEVSNCLSQLGLGMGPGSTPPFNLCPIYYLSASVKQPSRGTFWVILLFFFAFWI